jgi:hypothetical protein
LYSLIIAISIYFICQYLFVNMHGWAGIFLRSSVFALLMVAAIFGFKLTPDAHQLAVLTHEKLQPFIKKRK